MAVLVETDAPWLAPAPDRGKRNEPAFVTRTAHTLAGLLGVSGEEIASGHHEKLPRLFHLPPGRGKLIILRRGIACSSLSSLAV
jgi:TatD DNase family protein